MNVKFCSILANAEGEPVEGTAPEKDSAIFLPAHKSNWHRVSAKEKLEGISAISDLSHTIASFNRSLICYYSPNELSENQIFVADSSGIKCFSNTGFRIEREVKQLFAVCTDGKKDPCCSKFGIPIAKLFMKQCAEDQFSLIIETSHIGGCRFAATTVCFPSGNSYGRILPNHVNEIVNSEKRGSIVSKIFRGNVFVSEIHCWIMRHSMENFGYNPKPNQTKIVREGELIHVTIMHKGESKFRFDLFHQEKPFQLFSGCSNIESGRSIVRSIYNFNHPRTVLE